MKKHRLKLLTLLIAIFVVLFVLFTGLAIYAIPNQEKVQSVVQSFGAWGILAYFILATVSVIFTPLNYSMIGLIGGFLYGPILGFLLLWGARVLGTSTNFFLGRKFGRKILQYFADESELKKYDQLIESEKAVLIYFVLCFLPFLPGDYGGYFLGFSSMKKRVFIPITIVANVGSGFSLAYIGSGKAFGDPIFLTLFSIIFVAGIAWIHKQRKVYHLK